MNNLPKYFDPETLARIRPLGLRALTLVEGLVAGKHRSPLRGQSLEFSQHREYAAGDDMRQVDWKVFARSDKYYVRQYEDETNLTAMLLLDESESMDYRSNPEGLSKLEYAQLVACSLGYLVTLQQDSVGLATFSDQFHHWLNPGNSPAMLEDMVRLIEQPRPAHSRSDLSNVLQLCMDRLNKPNLVVILSDLLDDMQRSLRSIELMRLAGHDLIVLHVLDDWELSFPFDQTSEFEGLEGIPSMTVDPLTLCGAYRQTAQQFCREAELGCRKCGADYYRVLTNQSLAITLPEILSRRALRRI